MNLAQTVKGDERDMTITEGWMMMQGDEVFSRIRLSNYASLNKATEEQGMSAPFCSDPKKTYKLIFF